MTDTIEFKVVHGDATDCPCDVLAVKHAQSFYGVDELVAQRLAEAGIDTSLLRIEPGGFQVVPSRGAIAAKNVLVVGVVALRQFGYGQIREFGRKILSNLAGRDSSIAIVATTIQGVGYGLDEGESFRAQLAGLLEAYASSNCPGNLQSIIFVEQNPGRAQRLQEILSYSDDLFHGFSSDRPRESVSHLSLAADSSIANAGYQSDEKPFAFVAVPLSDEFDDVFRYGIASVVTAADLLCVDAGTDAFTDDILERIKRRIATARFVIADLTGADPNVYLEVGYAWGLKVPTILLIKGTAEDLKFDASGQLLLVYRNISDLEEKLSHAIRSLMRNQ